MLKMTLQIQGKTVEDLKESLRSALYDLETTDVDLIAACHGSCSDDDGSSTGSYAWEVKHAPGEDYSALATAPYGTLPYLEDEIYPEELA